MSFNFITILLLLLLLVNHSIAYSSEESFEDVTCILPKKCLPLDACMASSNMIYPEYCASNRKKICCEPKPPIFNMTTCGQTAAQNRIANGHNATILQYPWFALIGYKNEETGKIIFDCGGSLINGERQIEAFSIKICIIIKFRSICLDGSSLFNRHS
jgi:hypothetical protein